MANAAEAIRDDLIANDVRYRRADAAVRRKVDVRLSSLSRELRELIARIDIHGAQRVDARQRRLDKFEKEMKAAVRTAYSDINSLLRGEMNRIAKIETKATANAVRKHLP